MGSEYTTGERGVVVFSLNRVFPKEGSLFLDNSVQAEISDTEGEKEHT